MDPGTDVYQLRTKLEAEQSEKRELQSSFDSLQSKLNSQNTTLEQTSAELAMAKTGQLLPPNAKSGECYARVFSAPQYKTTTKTVLRRPSSERIEVTQPRYALAEEQVLVREASTEIRVIPAVYNWAEEKVLVSEASTKLVPVDPVYRNVDERVMVRPAYTTWKKGRGPIEKIDQATGEIMCLVDVPAEYKTVTKQVLVTPASTREIQIPAKYQTVKKRVMVKPARTETVEIPAGYKTIRVSKLVEPAKEMRSPVGEQTQTITETVLASEGRMEWRSILCETNTTPDVVSRLQRALNGAGHNAGPVDGIVGPRTMSAVSSYQAANGMAQGSLTIETLKKLGVM
ncbi:MAG: peptidoglycan-binding protein [Gammaproteobacteria bacterium]|nr:peptidoglycan-binding protein [Gammaproteobacteria bacterium]MDH3411235.1 peptidoglycan-binding protein [Gammaproteobacteria bacterium]